jgi:hypothetical protein
MKVRHSSEVPPVELDARVFEVLPAVSIRELQDYVAHVSLPRHAQVQAHENGLVRKHVANLLRSYGYDVQVLGQHFNVVAGPPDWPNQPCILIGAHYDSVPNSPGADDNASGLAVMLACARILTHFRPARPVLFVAFNSEEDGALGSEEFISIIASRRLRIQQVCILEMVGYASDRRGSQKTPPGLPLRIPDVGNFLGLVSNWHSRLVLDRLLGIAQTYIPDFPVLGLHMTPGVEILVPTMQRSDHAPFWRANIPALMWTDTAEFRNPHYHGPTDTPDTLDYAFMSQVLLLLLANCLHADAARPDWS